MTDCFPTWSLRNRVKPWATVGSLSLWARKSPPYAGGLRDVSAQSGPGLRALGAAFRDADVREGEPRSDELVIVPDRLISDGHVFPDRPVDDVRVGREPVQEGIHEDIVDVGRLAVIGQSGHDHD